MNADFYDTIARFYDAENAGMVDDLPLYSALARQVGGPVLDVGCGTGRVMLHLAQEGYRVVGMDHSEAMLARGQRKLEMLPDLKAQVSFVWGDVLNSDLDGRFKLVIMSYNGFMHFAEQSEQIAALRCFRDRLDEGGLLVIDLPNPAPAFGSEDDGAVVLERMFVEPESDHQVMQQSVSTLDRVTQQLDITWIYDEIDDEGLVIRTLAPLQLRYVFAAEMDLMLALTGLCRFEIYGDYARGPFADGCERMIVLARRVSGQEGSSV